MTQARERPPHVLRPAVDDLMACQKFAGRYVVQQVIGQGGMGTVYRARDLLVGDEVALKVLDRGLYSSQSAIERVRTEVRLTRKISHTNVVRTHDLNDAGGFFFITMELIYGCDLRALLAANEGAPLRAAHAAEIAVGVSSGLSAAHAAGVIHRDLKPANVLVDRSGRVVVTDFGIARALGEEATPESSGENAGTLIYMAPEQISGGAIDPRTDIYALGLLLFQMCTGSHPFMGDSAVLSAMSRLHSPPPDPRERADVPDLLAELTRRCLARDPEARPRAASDVADALKRWLSDTGGGGAIQSLSMLSMSTSSCAISTDDTIEVPEGLSSGMATPPSSKGPDKAGATRTLVVLPLRYHGPPAQEYLAGALTSELIDLLSRTHGICVLSGAVSAALKPGISVLTLRSRFGADVVVDGTVQSVDMNVRVSLRLVDAATGIQLWSERFSGTLEDVFDFQDTISQQIAEALRVKLGTSTHRGDATAEAIELYLQARCRAYTFQRLGSDGALELLERCLERAPNFAPAIAQHALACVRTWFLPGQTPGRDWETLARSSVARAEKLAADFAETHLARAMLSVQQSDWRAAVIALGHSLRIAPTCAPALQYLGLLLCETGRVEEGLARSRLAYKLDPSLGVCLIDIARISALRGDRAEAARMLERLLAHPAYRTARIQLELRVASWQGDLGRVRELLGELEPEPTELSIHSQCYARVVLGLVDPIPAFEDVHARLESGRSPRFVSLLCQLTSEALCLAGRAEAALDYFLRAAGTVLIDIEWVQRCPALVPLRALPGFAQGSRLVQRRVDGIWGDPRSFGSLPDP